MTAPTSGTITVNGLDPQRDRRRVVSRLGVAFGQLSRLERDLKLGESFELLRRIYRVALPEYRKNLEELVERLELTGLLDIPAGLLSAGQRMRGEIAAALLHTPDILFLDEPFKGLDPGTKERVMADTRRRCAGRTVLLVTHDLGETQALGAVQVLRLPQPEARL